MKAIKIDNNGLFMEDVLVKDDFKQTLTMITVSCPDGFYLPKWDGKAWVEGKTQVEMDAIKNTIQLNPDIELAAAINSATTLDELKKALTGNLLAGQKGKVKGQIA